MAGRSNPNDLPFPLYGNHSNGRNDKSGEKERNDSNIFGKSAAREENKDKGQKKVEVVDDDRKQSIWSLFSNVTSVDPGYAKDSKEQEVVPNSSSNSNANSKPKSTTNTTTTTKEQRTELSTPKSNLSNPVNQHTKTNALFKNVQMNKALMEEIGNINESIKRKNRILLLNKSGDDNDNILNSIKSVKRIKLNETKETAQRSAYNEFFNKNNTSGFKDTEKNEELLKNTLIKDASSKIREAFLATKQSNETKAEAETGIGIGTEKEIERENNLDAKKRKIPLLPVIKKTETCTTRTILKKKKICVPVHEINEKQLQQVSLKKIHAFHKDDKFDIFSRLGDDTFRYILMYIKNKKSLLDVNKRFSEMLQRLRNKLIYTESLKNSISPESIIKTIYASHNIEILDLSGCAHLTAHHFSILANSNNIKFNRSLKVLCLKNCNKVTDSSLKIFIQRFRNLRVLDIRNCYKISYEGIYPLRYKTTLMKLYLGNTISANVSNNHSNETLKVLFGSNDVDTVQLDCPLNKLICFEISYTRSLTDLSMLFYISQNLKILNLKGCSIDDSSSKFFKTFGHLLALNVSETKISNEVLYEVMAHSKKLKVLDISKTSDIHHKTLVDISRSFKELRKLKIAHLPQVDNYCVREVFKNAKYLMALDFSNCWKINNAFCDVNGLFIATGNKLKDIGAFQCSINKSICEGILTDVGCTNVRVHIYNELKLFEMSIYNDIEIVEGC